MRYLREWFRRELLWRVKTHGSKWDSYFRGKAEVRITHRPKVNGHVLDDWQIQTLAMCPTGGKVRVRHHQAEFMLEVTHPDLIETMRTNVVELRKDANGYYVYIDLVLFESSGIKGFGASAFLRMAQTAQQLEFQRIDLLAAGGTGYKNTWSRVFNGFHSWARFGFNAKLWPETLEKLKDYPHLQGCTELWDIIELDPDWWKANGDGSELSFDLRENSRSWHTLYTYLEKKGG